MAVELLSAKMIAPWFGSSLYVWTSVLGVTMMALAAGYYFGGLVSQKAGIKHLFQLLFIICLLLFLLPVNGQFILQQTLLMDVRTGSLIASLVIVFPPLFLMGMISPVIVSLCAEQGAGRMAGMVFAVSTLGGVISVLFCGFYIIPIVGLQGSTYLFAILMSISFLTAFSRKHLWS